MIHKIYFKIIILISIIMLAASCSDNDGKNFFENKTEKITLRFWMNPWIITPPGFPEGKTISNEDYPAWISKKFMEKFPGVKIEYTVVSNKELKQKISSAIAAGNPPDVFKYFDTKFAQAGLLLMNILLKLIKTIF